LICMHTITEIHSRQQAAREESLLPSMPTAPETATPQVRSTHISFIQFSLKSNIGRCSMQWQVCGSVVWVAVDKRAGTDNADNFNLNKK
jgi:hypothetical protein